MGMRRGAVVLVVAAACWVAPAGIAHAQQQAGEAPTIAAAGDGQVLLKPDRARLYVDVDRTRGTSRAARAVTNREVSRLVRTLRRHGIARKDVQTSYVTVSRERVRRHGHRRVRYRAATELDVRSSDVRHLGALISALSRAGADDVSGPDFGFSDPSLGVVRATRAALADARRRAEDAAARLGLRITGIQSVDLSPAEPGSEVGPPVAAGGSGSGSDTTRVLPGRQAFSATVRVVYTAAAA